MEFLKKKWQIIVIILLVLFGLNKCISSCSNENNYIQQVKINNQKDSIIKIYDDSVKTLFMHIQVLEATITGNQEMIDKLAKANEQISEAKKNINVNVRK